MIVFRKILVLIVFVYICATGRLLNCFAQNQLGNLSSGRFSSSSLLKRVSKMLTTSCEIPRGSAIPIVISVSGGQDSVALLRLVHQIASRHPWRLHVLHFNHGLRPESSQEEHFVRHLAQFLKVPFHLRRHADPGSLKTSKFGLQAAARSWRQTESKELLQVLEKDGKETDGGGAILLAHHANDQVHMRGCCCCCCCCCCCWCCCCSCCCCCCCCCSVVEVEEQCEQCQTYFIHI